MRIPSPALPRLLALAGLALSLPLAAQAFPTDGEPRHGASSHGDRACHHRQHQADGNDLEPARLPRALHHLNLSEAQRDAVFTLVHGQAPALRDKSKAVHKARTELHALTLSDKYDEAQARALAKVIADNSGALALQRARLEYDIHALLTPEQRKQLSDRQRDEPFQPTRAKSDAHQHLPRAM